MVEIIIAISFSILITALILNLINKSDEYERKFEAVKSVINGKWINSSIWSWMEYCCRMEGIYKGRKVRCGLRDSGYRSGSLSPSPIIEMKPNNVDNWLSWPWENFPEADSFKEQLERLAQYCEKIEKGEEPPPDDISDSVKYAWNKLWRK